MTSRYVNIAARALAVTISWLAARPVVRQGVMWYVIIEGVPALFSLGYSVLKHGTAGWLLAYTDPVTEGVLLSRWRDENNLGEGPLSEDDLTVFVAARAQARRGDSALGSDVIEIRNELLDNGFFV